MTHNTNSFSNAPLFPVELFYEIFENLPQSSLASVAQISSSFNDISERVMYRRIELTSLAQAMQCFKTLQKKPTLAQHIREFIIMFQGADNSPLEFKTLLSSTLRSLSQVTSLHLAIQGPFSPILDGCAFPRLNVFSSIIDLWPSWTPVASFLARHPTITHLCLGGESPGQNFLLSPDALPNLQAFMGSRRLAPVVVPRRPVSQVTLAWHARNVELEVNCVVPPLALTSISMRTFSCATSGWSCPLVRAIAAYLPKLHRLRLHNISADVNNEFEICKTLTEVLASFTELTRLEIPCHRGIKSILGVESEAAAVKAWQRQSPRLTFVLFPSSRVWTRGSNDIWSQVHQQL